MGRHMRNVTSLLNGITRQRLAREDMRILYHSEEEEMNNLTIEMGITYTPKCEKKVVLCTECEGTGKVFDYDEYYGGIMTGEKECPYCKGKGRLLRIRNTTFETL